MTYRYDGRGVRTITSDAKLALAIDPSQVIGSNPSTGTVTLTEPAPAGGATVTLASGDPTRVTVPASITIAAGQTTGTFTATGFAVPATASVPITATWSGVTATVTLTLTPGVWDVASLTLDPTDVLATQMTPGKLAGQTTATLTLNAAAPPPGLAVAISCPDAECPASLTVGTNATSATFTVVATAQAPVLCPNFQNADCPKSYQVNATFATTHSATFTVHTLDDGSWETGLGDLAASGDVFLATLAVAPQRLRGGRRATVTIELAADAPAEGVSIEMLSGNPAVFELPPRVFIPHGERLITFDAATGEVEAETTVRITATANGISRETTVTLEPPRHPLTLAFGAQFVAPHTSSGEIRRYSLYTPELNLLAKTDLGLSPTLAYEYVWFAGHPVAEFDLATTTVHWTFTDHLGTPIVQTDATAAVDWRAEYEPFGRVHAFRAGASRHQPLRLPGQEHDERTPERDYNVFRWYRAGWGRYTQGDPIGLLGGDNSFIYTHDNPIVATDRSGLRTCVIFTRSKTSGISWYSHTAIVVSGPCKNNGTSCSRPDKFLYDPAGSYRLRERGSGAVLENDMFRMDDYIRHHREDDGAEIEMLCYDTSCCDEQVLYDEATGTNDPRGPNCSISVGICLSKTSRFKDFSPSYVPGNCRVQLMNERLRDRTRK